MNAAAAISRRPFCAATAIALLPSLVIVECVMYRRVQYLAKMSLYLKWPRMVMARDGILARFNRQSRFRQVVCTPRSRNGRQCVFTLRSLYWTYKETRVVYFRVSLDLICSQ